MKLTRTLLAVVMALGAAPAFADYTVLQGTNVTFLVDLSQDFYQGLIPQVNGDSLVFRASDSTPILSALQSGNDTTTVISDNGFAESLLIVAKNGYNLKGLSGILEANSAASGSLAAGGTARFAAAQGFSLANAIAQGSSWTQGASLGNALYLTGSLYQNSAGSTQSFSSLLAQTGSDQQVPAIAGRAVYLNGWAIGAGIYSSGALGNPQFQHDLNGFGVSAAVQAVPEPETWALMGLGLTALLLRRRKSNAVAAQAIAEQ